MKSSRLFAAILISIGFTHGITFADELQPRPAWTTSRISGTPEVPPPYRAERIYADLKFDQPVEMVHAPTLGGPVVVERKGKMFLLSDDKASDKKTLFFDGAEEVEGLTAVYGLAFHPNFAENRLCYVCYILKPQTERGTRVSRFRVSDTSPPRIDAESETILIDDWRSGGHNGGCLRFGPEGYLYISTGDSSPADPPDVHNTGQNLTDFHACILRIDVDRQQKGLKYAIPKDNPFVGVEGARGEIWAYGLRNPWRMSFDRKTNDLWVGDVGWQLWEMVYRIERGGNYGWSVKEGPQDVRAEAQRGPTPILPPVIALPRSEAASVTGGYVYRGKRHQDLRGDYIYGDYVTGKIWALRHDGNKLIKQQELARTAVAIIAFYQSPKGELAFMDYRGGTIHRLQRTEQESNAAAKFPRKLSETGLFASTKEHKPSAGVAPFSINASLWADGGTSEYLVAIPGQQSIALNNPTELVPLKWGSFPKDTVLAKTISIETEPGNRKSRRRIETQILHYIGKNWRGNSGEWRGYSYVWNKAQTDASLAPAEGLDVKLPVGGQERNWHIASRSECYTCHNPWAGYRLAFTPEQLQRPDDLYGTKLNQLDVLSKLRVLATAHQSTDEHDDDSETFDLRATKSLVDPHDQDADLDARARSYLHVNCSHCHRFGGGGTATIDFRFDRTVEQMKAIGVRPTQGTFEIHTANIIAPGHPERSALMYRLLTGGRGRMPQLGPRTIDEAGLELLHEWITALKPADDEAQQIRLKEAFDRQSDLLKRLSQSADEAQTALIDEALASTSTTLRLVHGLGSNERLSAAVSARAAKHPKPHIRDLFHRYLPEEQRAKTLGSAISNQQILSLDGNAEQGENLFLRTDGMQCKNCHRVGEVGGQLGPALAGVGKRLSRTELLEAIVEPSKTIHPKFVTHLLETTDGQVYSGLLKRKTDDEVELQISPDESIHVAANKVALLAQQPKSLMPDLLFRDMTAQQLADLLAYLQSLK